MGQQWWAMGRELLAQEPVFRRALEEVSDLFGGLAGWSLLDKLTADEQASRIQETRIGQPAIFALQVALAALWRSWGVEPAAVLGHSAGEMAASYISGALSLEDAVRVTFHRSRLQHRTAGQGAMLAVGMSREEATQMGRTPPACHLDRGHQRPEFGHALRRRGGARRDRQGAQRRRMCSAAPCGWTCPITAPRWSSSKRSCLDCLRDIRPRPASTPFFSTVTGTALAGSELDAQYWYRNVRQPVLFHDTIARLVDAGHRVFLEIGAHPILRHDIAQCLNEKSSAGTTLCSLRRDDRERAALLGSLGRHVYPWRRDRLAEALSGRGDGDQAADLSVSARQFIGGNPSTTRRMRGEPSGASAAGKPARGIEAVLERDAGHGRA